MTTTEINEAKTDSLSIIQEEIIDSMDENTDIDIVTMIDQDSGDIYVKLPSQLVSILKWTNDTQLVWVVDDKNGYILGKKSD